MKSWVQKWGIGISVWFALLSFVFAFVAAAEVFLLFAAIFFSAAVIAAQHGDQEFHEKS